MLLAKLDMEQAMALGFSLKPVLGLMLATAMTLNASPSFAKGAAPEAASAPKAQSPKLRCKKGGDPLNPKKCVPVAQAEPKVAKSNGLLPFLPLPIIAGTAAVAAAANSKNCGKGNNSQNNGNCPASP